MSVDTVLTFKLSVSDGKTSTTDTVSITVSNTSTPPPAPICGRMTGGGSLYTSTGMQVTHGFTLHCNDENPANVLQVNWKGYSFHMGKLTSSSCSDDPAINPGCFKPGFDTISGTGIGWLNGVWGATVEFTFKDAGEPGTRDTGSIVIRNKSGNVVLSVSSPLKHGNYQAHKWFCYKPCSLIGNWYNVIDNIKDNWFGGCNDNWKNDSKDDCKNNCNDNGKDNDKGNSKSKGTCRD